MNKKIINNEIPIFFACDDNYIPYLCVAAHSLIKNADKKCYYKIIILNGGISEENKAKVLKLEKPNVGIEFFDVSEKILKFKKDLSVRLRDYYSDAIYYRIFIPSLFARYDKAIYLDGDLVVLEDISKLYETDMESFLVAAVNDKLVTGNEIFCEYAKNAVGIEPQKYFNSGMLLMNLRKFREENVEARFLDLLTRYNFDTVAPDQDYLNVLCKGKVRYLDTGWNKMPLPDPEFDDKNLKIIHYNSFDKPWHYSGVLYENYFWKFAEETEFYEFLLNKKNNYSDADVQKDRRGGASLVANAKNITDNEKVTFKKVLPALGGALTETNGVQATENEVLSNIKKAVKEGNLNCKVQPGDHKVTPEERKRYILGYDITKRKILNKVKNYLANIIVNGISQRVNANTKIKGLENIAKVKTGAIITCNHFNPVDSTIVRTVVNKIGRKNRLSIVVAETNIFMRGTLGWILRNSNTLPLSENLDYQNSFNDAMKMLLDKKQFILIYPEQEMWLNYRKPRPLKNGAYHYAAKFNVPVIPCFVEMHQTANGNADYVINIFPPIYPCQSKTLKENKTEMRDLDYSLKIKAYEAAYNKKLDYSFEEDDVLKM